MFFISPVFNKVNKSKVKPEADLLAGEAGLGEAGGHHVQEDALRHHQVPPAVLRHAQQSPHRPHLRRAVAGSHGLGDDAERVPRQEKGAANQLFTLLT